MSLLYNCFTNRNLFLCCSECHSVKKSQIISLFSFQVSGTAVYLRYQVTLEERTVLAAALHERPQIETDILYGAVCSSVVQVVIWIDMNAYIDTAYI
jgi:hypothetical protein